MPRNAVAPLPAADKMPSVKFSSEQIRALEYAWGMSRTMLTNSYRYLYIGHSLFVAITVLTLGTIVTTTWYGTLSAEQQADADYVNSINLVVPLVTGMLIAINALIKPVQLWATCCLASTKIECQIYMFRCAVGPYALDRETPRQIGDGTAINGVECALQPPALHVQAVAQQSPASRPSSNSAFCCILLLALCTDLTPLFEIDASAGLPVFTAAIEAVWEEIQNSELRFGGLRMDETPFKHRDPWLTKGKGCFNSEHKRARKSYATRTFESNRSRVENDEQDDGFSPMTMPQYVQVRHRPSHPPPQPIQSQRTSAQATWGVQHRMLFQLDKYSSTTPGMSSRTTAMQVLVVLATTGASLLVSLDYARWVPVLLGVSATLGALPSHALQAMARAATYSCNPYGEFLLQL